MLLEATVLNASPTQASKLRPTPRVAAALQAREELMQQVDKDGDGKISQELQQSIKAGCGKLGLPAPQFPVCPTVAHHFKSASTGIRKFASKDVGYAGCICKTSRTAHLHPCALQKGLMPTSRKSEQTRTLQEREGGLWPPASKPQPCQIEVHRPKPKLYAEAPKPHIFGS